MKSKSTKLDWIGFLLLILVPVPARAEVVVAESIEWVLASSDRVLIGKVVKIDKVTDRDNQQCQALTVAVTRTLKGAHSHHVTFLLRPYISEYGYAKQWQEEGIPLVFFLSKNDGKRISIPANKFAWILRDDENGPNAILLGKSKHHWTGSLRVCTRTFDILKVPNTILKYLEDVQKASGKEKNPKGHALGVPGGTAVYKELWSLSAVFLIVPVDRKLEELGQKWCGSRSPHTRTEGARILRHFKSEKNIAILKLLLADPATAEETRHETVPGRNELEQVYRKKVYYVRQAAFAALQDFGAKVEKPVLEVMLEGRGGPDPKSVGPGNK